MNYVQKQLKEERSVYVFEGSEECSLQIEYDNSGHEHMKRVRKKVGRRRRQRRAGRQHKGHSGTLASTKKASIEEDKILLKKIITQLEKSLYQYKETDNKPSKI